MFGADAIWTLDRQLMAYAADSLALANWQRGDGKKADKPKPIERPGGPSVKRIGDAGKLSQAQIRALLDARKPRQTTEE